MSTSERTPQEGPILRFFLTDDSTPAIKIEVPAPERSDKDCVYKQGEKLSLGATTPDAVFGITMAGRPENKGHYTLSEPIYRTLLSIADRAAQTTAPASNGASGTHGVTVSAVAPGGPPFRTVNLSIAEAQKHGVDRQFIWNTFGRRDAKTGKVLTPKTHKEFEFHLPANARFFIDDEARQFVLKSQPDAPEHLPFADAWAANDEGPAFISPDKLSENLKRILSKVTKKPIDVLQYHLHIDFRAHTEDDIAALMSSPELKEPLTYIKWAPKSLSGRLGQKNLDLAAEVNIRIPLKRATEWAQNPKYKKFYRNGKGVRLLVVFGIISILAIFMLSGLDLWLQNDNQANGPHPVDLSCEALVNPTESQVIKTQFGKSRTYCTETTRVELGQATTIEMIPKKTGATDALPTFRLPAGNLIIQENSNGRDLGVGVFSAPEKASRGLGVLAMGTKYSVTRGRTCNCIELSKFPCGKDDTLEYTLLTVFDGTVQFGHAALQTDGTLKFETSPHEALDAVISTKCGKMPQNKEQLFQQTGCFLKLGGHAGEPKAAIAITHIRRTPGSQEETNFDPVEIPVDDTIRLDSLGIVQLIRSLRPTLPPSPPGSGGELPPAPPIDAGTDASSKVNPGKRSLILNWDEKTTTSVSCNGTSITRNKTEVPLPNHTTTINCSAICANDPAGTGARQVQVNYPNKGNGTKSVSIEPCN